MIDIKKLSNKFDSFLEDFDEDELQAWLILDDLREMMNENLLITGKDAILFEENMVKNSNSSISEYELAKLKESYDRFNKNK